MKNRLRRRGFTLIDIPVALVLIGLLGLVFILTIRLFYGPLPWYVWIIGPLALPMALIALFGTWYLISGTKRE